VKNNFKEAENICILLPTSSYFHKYNNFFYSMRQSCISAKCDDVDEEEKK
jgi:hypothetical protein